MTTENIVQDTEESRIAQQKRDTLHRLLCILAENSDSASGFLSIEVKDVAKRVDEAYDHLCLKCGLVSTLNTLVDTMPLSDNVRSVYENTDDGIVCTNAVSNTASAFKASKKEYAKYPSYVTSISFGEIQDVDGQLRMEAQITWSDGSKAEKSVWCGSLGTSKEEAERIARERIWVYANSKDDLAL